MPIQTDFGFEHIQNTSAETKAFLERAVEDDLLGLLRLLVGGQSADKPSRIWEGTGFNMIWRPMFENGQPGHFLQMNMTAETLSVTDITGSGIANRGFFQPDILLGGIAYLQEIKDTFDNSNQHFEPGVFNHVPATQDPSEPTTVVRMGSIPHGTTINMQGRAFEVGAPQIDPVSIVPFQIGRPDRLVSFPEQDLSLPTGARTPLNQVPGLDQAHLDNPNLFLTDALAGQTIERTVVIDITTTGGNPPPPSVGGGTANIAFLEGTASGPNSVVPLARSIFWIEQGSDRDGSELLQLQYTQMVLLDFGGLSWPHVTVATMRPR